MPKIPATRDGLKAAAVALATAMDVFAEEGMRSLTDLAHQALERLRTRHATT